MSQYKITNEELTDFARKIYEEACCGYLDLKDSVCDRMVRNFIDGRQIVGDAESLYQGYEEARQSHAANTANTANVTIGGYQGHPGPDNYAGPENNPGTWIYSNQNSAETPHPYDGQFGMSHIHIYTSSSGNSISLRDEASVSPREENLVRENNFLTNYEGNESERF